MSAEAFEELVRGVEISVSDFKLELEDASSVSSVESSATLIATVGRGALTVAEKRRGWGLFFVIATGE